MLRRHLEPELIAAARKMPVVTLMGPRQSGKTTLVRGVFGSTHQYVSLERPDVRARALEDPLSFLGRLSEGAILDEVQRAPDLLSYIQGVVDEDDRPGRFILTGSHNLLLMESVSQTLAGRTALLYLLPLSIHELAGREPPDLESLDAAPGRVEAAFDFGRWEIVWKGLYPRIHDQSLDPNHWYPDYFRTYVERDLRSVLRVADLTAFERFVQLVAARTGQELNYTSLASDAGISQPTAKSWLTALEVSFLVAILPPFYKSYRKRLRKNGKIHFLDTGLACYLLGIRDPETLARHPLRGHLFESFVASELTKNFWNRRREPRLYHWRDATGHEIDLIIDLGDRQVPVEVKSGETIASDFFAGLEWWTSLAGNENESGVLVYGGLEADFRRKVAVRPWFLG